MAMPVDPTDFEHPELNPVRTGRTRGTKPGLYGKVYGDLDTRTRALEKRVDGEWIYVGTYPSDDDTTPDSPVFKNNWENFGGDQQTLRFRWTLSGKIEIEGVIDGGAIGTVIFTLPARYRPDADYKLPWADKNDTPAVLCVKTNGDVVFCAIASGTYGGDGDPFDVYTSFGELLGWWRFGEAGPPAEGYEFENIAYPQAPASSIVVDEQPNMSASRLSMGEGSQRLGDWDDGALGMIGDHALMTATEVYESPPSGGNLPFTIACWIAPGYIDGETPGGIFTPWGQIAGGVEMNTAGSFNVGSGLVWNPYHQDGGGVLQWWRLGEGGIAGDEVTKISIPIPNFYLYGSNGGGWWSANGYDFTFFIPPSMKTPSPDGSDPWFHAAITYDGTTIRCYVNATLATQEESTFEADRPFGASIEVGSAVFDFGVTEIRGFYRGAIDELAIWSKALTATQIGAIYRTGQDPTSGGYWQTIDGTQIQDGSVSNDKIGSVKQFKVVTDVVETSTDYTMDSEDSLVLVDSSGGAVTITLPGAANGVVVTIKKSTGDSNTITIDGDDIDGANDISFTAARGWRTLQRGSAGWFIIGSG